MSNAQEIASLTSNPLTYVAATVFLHYLTILKQQYTRPKKETTDGYTEQLTCIDRALRESINVSREVAKTVTAIASAQVESDETEDTMVRQLEKLIDSIDSLSNLHKDPDSKFATVKVLEKEDEIIRMLNSIQLTLARMK